MEHKLDLTSFANAIYQLQDSLDLYHSAPPKMIPPKMDIQLKDLAIVESILKKYLPPNTTVWMFGSRAKNQARKFSDLDLAVDAGEKLSSTILTNIKFDLEESDLPYKVRVFI